MNGHGREKKWNLTSKIYSLVEEWLKLDMNLKTRGEVEALAEEGNEGQLMQLLGKRMVFGTAGLRARMGAGFCRMNDLTVIQTTQGLACYLVEQFDEDAARVRGVIVGYDARHNSLRFAQLAAAVFLNKGFKVYLFSQHTPTPYNPYCIKVHRAIAGVQVTASHNPKEDNGYKVFWDNGAQIIPPHDSGISSHISAQSTPWSTSWDTSILNNNPNVIDPLVLGTIDAYFSDLKEYCFSMDMMSVWRLLEGEQPLPLSRSSENHNTDLRFTFSPMHGVGGEAVVRAFEVFNLPELIPVAEQMQPDPEFPTVKFPNPEEGKSALDLAMLTADANGSPLILATDPDADRLALAERNPTTNKWKIFSGNELGALLSWWAFKNYKERHPNFDGSKVYMLASTVSSKFIQSMGNVEGFQFEETLTGFKWMGNRAHQLMKQGHDVLFAYEEAIGFMFGTTVLDKDGISAAAVMAEYAIWLYSQGKTFSTHVEELYVRYGRYMSEVSYFICHERETIDAIFNNLRGNRKYPLKCGCSKVVSVLDLTVGYDSTRPPHYKPVLPVDPGCQLIKFTLENRCVFTLRTSGTEPKLKYYVEVASEPGTLVPEEKMREILQAAIKCITEEFLQAEHYGLLPRPT